MDILKSDVLRYVAEWDSGIARLKAELAHAEAERENWRRFLVGDPAVNTAELFEGCRLVDDVAGDQAARGLLSEIFGDRDLAGELDH